jgi:catalase
MPLPSDEKIIALSEKVIAAFDTIFGLHPGFRPAHAKGLLIAGTFTPSADATKLTRAPHAKRESTPVFARFSNSTGLPAIPDNDSNADPRGLAVRFQLGEHLHTDIVSHAANGFPTRTGEEFLELLQAIAASAPGGGSPSPVEKFLAAHPAALAYIQTPKPMPASFASEEYFGVTAMRFTNDEGASRYGRYRIQPESGVEHFDAETGKSKTADFLFEELRERINSRPIRFRIQVQLANDEDIVNDATVRWPENRAAIELGTLALSSVVPENGHAQQQIIFDPIPRVDGIEPSDDPLLELRAAIYLLSGRRRRTAELEVASGASR